MDFRWLDFQEVTAITNRNLLASEMAAAVNRRVRLRYQIIFFLIARQVIDRVRNATIRDLAIRRFDKTKVVDAREGRHRTDKTNVWAFWRFDRTNPAVMRRMNVAHFESGAIARETAWSKG